MGSIDMIKPLSTVQSSAVNKSQQHQENNYQREKILGTRRIEPGAAGCEAKTLSMRQSTEAESSEALESVNTL